MHSNEYDSRDEAEDCELSLKREIYFLSRSTFRLKMIGMILFVTTACFIALTVFYSFQSVLSGKMVSSSFSRREILSSDAFILLAALVVLNNGLLAYSFEALRKRGDIYFSEISQEVQSRRAKSARAESGAEGGVPLRIRIALREFSSAADLPLVPGNLGPVVYFLGTVATGIVGVALRRLYSGG